MTSIDSNDICPMCSKSYCDETGCCDGSKNCDWESRGYTTCDCWACMDCWKSVKLNSDREYLCPMCNTNLTDWISSVVEAYNDEKNDEKNDEIKREIVLVEEEEEVYSEDRERFKELYKIALSYANEENKGERYDMYPFKELVEILRSKYLSLSNEEMQYFVAVENALNNYKDGICRVKGAIKKVIKNL